MRRISYINGISGVTPGGVATLKMPLGRRFLDVKIICGYPCGAASAVATKIALEKYPDAEIYRNDTGSEHPDN